MKKVSFVEMYSNNKLEEFIDHHEEEKEILGDYDLRKYNPDYMEEE